MRNTMSVIPIQPAEKSYIGGSHDAGTIRVPGLPEPFRIRAEIRMGVHRDGQPRKPAMMPVCKED